MRGEEVPPFEPLERAIPAPPGLFDFAVESPTAGDGGGQRLDDLRDDAFLGEAGADRD